METPPRRLPPPPPPAPWRIYPDPPAPPEPPWYRDGVLLGFVAFVVLAIGLIGAVMLESEGVWELGLVGERPEACRVLVEGKTAFVDCRD